eukprot:2671930-Pyramimonas_sp.AAC.1
MPSPPRVLHRVRALGALREPRGRREATRDEGPVLGGRALRPRTRDPQDTLPPRRCLAERG